MKTRILYLSAALVLFFTGVFCFGLQQDKDDLDEIVKANNEFAFEFFAELGDSRGNLFFSPYSISTALAMTYAGARGETEKEMTGVLSVPLVEPEIRPDESGVFWPQQRYHKACGKLLKQINEQGQEGNYELVTANALWGQSGYKFLDEFVSLIEENYQGGLNEVDYVNAAEAARQKINNWVEKKTKDKIRELIKKGILGRDTRLVLTNAIYFKGNWASQFKPEETKQKSFYLEDGGQAQTDLMRQTKEFGYLETDSFQLLEMPYVDKQLSMLVFLPKKGLKVSDVQEQMNNENLSKWLNQLREVEVDIYFPKFKVTWQSELSSVLSGLGMKNAFTGMADFSGMTGSKDLFISKVVHKAFVEVNEEGTEAAAATGVVMSLTAVKPEPMVFRADRPFLFVIKDNVSGSILFIGRFSEPES